MKRILLSLLLVGIIASPSAMAVVLEGLYSSEQPVSDRSVSERTDALKKGLEEVLVKVTGDREIAFSPELATYFKNPERWVLQFNYRQRRDGRLVINADYNEKAIYQALQNYGLMFWPKNRPQVLIWLALEDGATRRVLDGQDQEVLPMIQFAAQQRGLPVAAPLYDLEDQAKVPFTSIWGGFIDDIVAASERYRASNYAVVKVYRQGSGGWVAEWQFQASGESLRWQQRADELPELIAGGVNELADMMAERYAFVPGEFNRQQVSVSVQNVRQVQQIGVLENYLVALPGVKKVLLKKVAGKTFNYNLEVEGQVDAVFDQLNRSDMLLLVEEQFPDSFANTRHNIYQLIQ